MTDVAEQAQAVDCTIVSGPVEGKSAAEYELFFARRALAKLKDRLGREGLRELLKPDTEASEAQWAEWIAASNGEFKPAITVLRVTGLSSAEFAAYFDRIRGDEPKLLEAHPEHFVVGRTGDGFDVVENIGPYISQTYVHFTGEDEAIDELLPEYPIRMIGYGTKPNGEISGHVLHQMRDTEDGFEARLAIYYPAACPEEIFEGHRQHLAVEFANWIAAAARELGRDTVVD